MNFSEALKAMKMGSKVSRELWRGRISHIYRDDVLFMVVYPGGMEILLTNFTTQEVLADDWFVVT